MTLADPDNFLGANIVFDRDLDIDISCQKVILSPLARLHLDTIVQYYTIL